MERERERKRKRKKEREGVYVWQKEIFLSLMETIEYATSFKYAIFSYILLVKYMYRINGIEGG